MSEGENSPDMAVALPNEFDTSGVVKVILRGMLALLFVLVVPGIIYSLVVSHRAAAAAQLLLACLVGKAGAPDILIARTALDAGRALGEEFAAVLNLPYQEERAPY